ncbi:MAG TPA: hypothetical protein VIW29_23020 [Polyangiaceae bacterium]
MLAPPHPKQSHGVRIVFGVLAGTLALLALIAYVLVRFFSH